METKQTEVETIESTEQVNEKLNSAIMLAIELDSAFKLYSYRITSPESYQARVKDLVDFYNTKHK